MATLYSEYQFILNYKTNQIASNTHILMNMIYALLTIL